MGKRLFRIQVVAGTRVSPTGDKVFWLLSPIDWRVYVVPENKNIDDIAVEVDDFLGVVPEGCCFDIETTGNKRSKDIVKRINMFWDKQNKEDEEDIW